MRCQLFLLDCMYTPQRKANKILRLCTKGGEEQENDRFPQMPSLEDRALDGFSEIRHNGPLLFREKCTFMVCDRIGNCLPRTVWSRKAACVCAQRPQRTSQQTSRADAKRSDPSLSVVVQHRQFRQRVRLFCCRGERSLQLDG